MCEGSVVPHHTERVATSHGRPRGVGDDRNTFFDLQHLADATDRLRLRPVKLSDLAAKDGAARHGGVEHAGDPNVHTESRAAVHLFGAIETADAPAEDAEGGRVFRVLERNVPRNRESRGGCGECSVAQAPAGSGVDDYSVPRVAARWLHTPRLPGGSDH